MIQRCYYVLRIIGIFSVDTKLCLISFGYFFLVDNFLFWSFSFSLFAHKEHCCGITNSLDPASLLASFLQGVVWGVQLGRKSRCVLFSLSTFCWVENSLQRATYSHDSSLGCLSNHSMRCYPSLVVEVSFGDKR